MPFRLAFAPPVALGRIGLIDLGQDEAATVVARCSSGTNVNLEIKDSLVDIHGVTKDGCSDVEIAAIGASQFGVNLVELERAAPQVTSATSATSANVEDTTTDVVEASDDSGATGALDDLTIGLIAAGGALLLIMLLAFALWIVRRRRGQQSDSASGRDWLQPSRRSTAITLVTFAARVVMRLDSMSMTNE